MFGWRRKTIPQSGCRIEWCRPPLQMDKSKCDYELKMNPMVSWRWLLPGEAINDCQSDEREDPYIYQDKYLPDLNSCEKWPISNCQQDCWRNCPDKMPRETKRLERRFPRVTLKDKHQPVIISHVEQNRTLDGADWLMVYVVCQWERLDVLLKSKLPWKGPK